MSETKSQLLKRLQPTIKAIQTSIPENTSIKTVIDAMCFLIADAVLQEEDVAVRQIVRDMLIERFKDMPI